MLYQFYSLLARQMLNVETKTRSFVSLRMFVYLCSQMVEIREFWT